ncbi:MAG TPA: cytidine deaminase [Bacteroidetes bacterium]|nr:cytidine deaminase [bacterium BMS3Bbin04]HDO66448.1 cytidine deaminase [Bacteroidota bacterium]HEX05573.1 cytidine deaminase [Bacteroidota bacterium]
MKERNRSADSMDDSIVELIRPARRARRNAVTPLTHHAVGAALEDDDGKVWIGCDIESRYPGHGITAERVALYSALASGARSFRRIAVVGTVGDGLPRPCGASLEALIEHAPNLQIILFNPGISEWASYQIRELLPSPDNISI